MTDLEFIKENYGENMVKLCQKEFPDLIKQKGVLKSILGTNFAQNHHLAEDIDVKKFKEYVGSFFNGESVAPKSFLKRFSYIENGGLYYRVNKESMRPHTRFCENNVCFDEDMKIHKFNEDRYLLLEEFLIDFKDNRICDPITFEDLSCKFVGELEDGNNKISSIQRYTRASEIDGAELNCLQIIANDGKVINIQYNKSNQIQSYTNNGCTCFSGYNILNLRPELVKVEMLNLEKMNYDVGICSNCPKLSKVALPNLKFAGRGSFFTGFGNKSIIINLPSLEETEDMCFWGDNMKISAPNLKKMGDKCCNYISEFDAPSLVEMGKDCFEERPELKKKAERQIVLNKYGDLLSDYVDNKKSSSKSGKDDESQAPSGR